MSSRGYLHGFQLDATHSLHIYMGSLAEVQADALVSSDDNWLSASGGVSSALADGAGPAVRRECERLVHQQRPQLGEVVRTSAGGLPCRYLYHGITIDFDRDQRLDEAALRRLMANLISRAALDGVKSLGLPALGTGSAIFELSRAAEIIIDELLTRLVATPIERTVLALHGDLAERLFYQKLVRSNSERCASTSLRNREAVIEAPPPVIIADNPSLAPTINASTVEAVALPVALAAAADGETIEQFPSLVDEQRLAVAGPGQPRLVDGLADLILKYADERELQEELLSLPQCRSFRGTVKQRLMEFLYLSENNLRMALGPMLFRNRELRKMLDDLGQDLELARDHDQLVSEILRSLCFNMVAPPTGMADHISRLERLLADVRRHEADEQSVQYAAMEAGKLLEVTLKDLLRMYGWLFWGAEYETELVQRRVLEPRHDGNALTRATVGQAREALDKLQALSQREPPLAAKVAALPRPSRDFLPQRIQLQNGVPLLDAQPLLQEVIQLRNAAVHQNDDWPRLRQRDDVARKLDNLHAFFCACQAEGAYPAVLRYEGTFENRNGERFVYFVDEDGKDREVRTDERIDPRRHYYCFAANNPVHLYPTLIPKL